MHKLRHTMLSSIRVPRDIINPWINQESIFRDADKIALTELSSVKDKLDDIQSSNLAPWLTALFSSIAVLGMILLLINVKFFRTFLWIVIGYLRALASSFVGRTRLIVLIEVERDGITQSVIRLSEYVLSEDSSTTEEHIDMPKDASVNTPLVPSPEQSSSTSIVASALDESADLDVEQDLDNVSFYSIQSDLL